MGSERTYLWNIREHKGPRVAMLNFGMKNNIEDHHPSNISAKIGSIDSGVFWGKFEIWKDNGRWDRQNSLVAL